MKLMYIYSSLGFGLVLMITLVGVAFDPVITGMLPQSYLQDDIPDDYFPQQIYEVNLIPHDLSNFSSEVVSLSIQYLKFNTSLIARPDPYFTGIIVTREAALKQQYRNNESMWKLHIFQGFRYDEWGIAQVYGTHEPAIYIHETYIAYEVDKLARRLILSLQNAPEVNTTALEYNLKVNELYDDSGIPDQRIAYYSVSFQNGTRIKIEAHQDGWLIYYPIEACGSGWTTGNNTPIRCQGYYADLLVVKDFAMSFVNFHEFFSDFVNNRIMS